jgi:DNA invertase Pin-like site-specific DNA recombinase
MAHEVGYARVSKREQNPKSQEAELRAASCERVDTIRDNTQRGLDYARSQGRVGGRPRVMTVERVAAAERMRAEHQSWESIGRVLGVGASSVRRALSNGGPVARPVNGVNRFPY